MSYLRKIEYEIIPVESFRVIRNCSGCGRKTYFRNTKRFRVNANGNKLDVWLIYQCENCKHTLNLTVYERQRPDLIPAKEYECFLSNDEGLAEEYGKKLPFFQKNKAEADLQNIEYQFVKRREITGQPPCGQQVWITIQNPYGLRIRPERQIAEALGLSRSQVKKRMEQGEIQIGTVLAQLLSFYVDCYCV